MWVRLNLFTDFLQKISIEGKKGKRHNFCPLQMLFANQRANPYTTGMLYLIYGSDKDMARKKSNDMVAALLAKKPDASTVRLDEESLTGAALDEYIGSQALFVQKSIVLIDGVLTAMKSGGKAGELAELKEKKEALVSRLQEIASSENIFIMREGVLDKVSLGKIEKVAVKVQVCGTEKKPEGGGSGGGRGKKVSGAKNDGPNLFALCDALGHRDRKSLWVLYHQAKMDGAEDEQIHSMLWWQMKTMGIARVTKSAADAGLKPFVYEKATRAAVNFPGDELRTKSRELITLYHDSRRGHHDLAEATEKFLLTV